MELQAKILANYLDSQNPFQWKPHTELEVVPQNMIEPIKRKMAEKIMEDDLEYEMAILPLIACYEYYVKNQITEALTYLEEAEKKIGIFIQGQKSTSHYDKCIPALRHLISSSKTHILVQMNKFEDAYKESCKIEPVSEDPVIWGLKASFYSEYGIYGTKLALKFAIKANEMDPDDSMWYFLKGKFLGRIRRVEKPFDIPSEVELKCLEKALDKEMRASYTIFTAQIYRETARSMHNMEMKRNTLYPQVKKSIDEMTKKSYQLYKKSLELKPKCPHMMFRCAKGFIMFPQPLNDDELVKQLLDDGFRLAPESPYGHHVAATFYERRKKDLNKAKYHLQIAANHKVYGAAIDLLRLELFTGDISQLQAVSRLEKFCDEYVEPPRRCQLLAQLTSYYIFERQDIRKAFEYFRKLLSIDANDLNMLNHRSIFLKYRGTFSLQDLVIDEIKLAFQSKTCTNEERKTLTDYLTEMFDLGVEVGAKPPIYLKNSIRNSIANNQQENWRVFAPKCPNQQREYRYSQAKANVRKNDPYVTKSDVVRKIDSFCDNWKKDIKSKSNQYQASKFTSKDYISKNEEAALDNDDSVSQLRLKIYQDTNRITEKKFRDYSNRDIRSPKTERSWRTSKTSIESSKTESSWRIRKTPNDGDYLYESSKTIDQRQLANKTRSNDDFDQLMANYRKMKISQSQNRNYGNAARDKNRTNDRNLMKERQRDENRADPDPNYGRTSGNSHRRAEMHSKKRTPKRNEGSSDEDEIKMAIKQLDTPFKPGNIRF